VKKKTFLFAIQQDGNHLQHPVAHTRTVETMKERKGETERIYSEKHLGMSFDDDALVCKKTFPWGQDTVKIVSILFLEKTKSKLTESFKPQHGSDTMLQKCIDEWTCKKITKAILDTVMYAANSLLLGKAVLLPWASQVFLYVYDTEHAHCTTPTQRTSIVMGESN